MNNYVIDLVNILSYLIGVQNLNSNEEQVKQLEELIKKVDFHLKEQDFKLDKILENSAFGIQNKQYEEIITLLKEVQNGRK